MTQPQTSRRQRETIAGKRRPMRRADREITDLANIEAIVHSCNIVHVSFADVEGQAVFPLNFGYSLAKSQSQQPRLTLFLHSALEGRKVDSITSANNHLEVAFEMSTDHVLISGKTPSSWAEDFRSVMGSGVASIVSDIDECRTALCALTRHQAGMHHVELTDVQIRTVTVWKIESDYFTAKIHVSPRAEERARIWRPA
jgi:nitroimidazol reductase NimA-like FMN-containing flavoprotein (pyridoxamine 5'-phosphate oxidase superfamily)